MVSGTESWELTLWAISMKQRVKRKEVRLSSQKHVLRYVLPPARAHFLNFSIQDNQLGSQYSNTQYFAGHFSSKPLQQPCYKYALPIWKSPSTTSTSCLQKVFGVIIVFKHLEKYGLLTESDTVRKSISEDLQDEILTPLLSSLVLFSFPIPPLLAVALPFSFGWIFEKGYHYVAQVVFFSTCPKRWGYRHVLICISQLDLFLHPL